jgi:hypothetical protein
LEKKAKNTKSKSSDLEGQIDVLTHAINTARKIDAFLEGKKLTRITIVCQGEEEFAFGMKNKDYPGLTEDILALANKYRDSANNHMKILVEKANAELE